MKFYIPPNINKNFTDALNGPPGTEFIINFNNNNTVKAITPELDYRAKQEGIRSVKPLHAEPNKLKVGDYLQADGDTFIVAYLKNLKFPTCSEVQVQICNNKVTISRFQKEVIDNRGKIVTPARDIDIVSDIYSVIMSSGYQFQTYNGSIGIIPTNTIAIQMQYNNSTKNIKIDDTLIYFNSTYRIESFDYGQANMDNQDGMFIIFAKKIQ